MSTSSRRLLLPSLSLGLLAIVALGVGSSDVAAQGRRARLSKDLEQKIAAGDVRTTSVILTASQARVDEVAARHGLRISKRLATGAVLEVPAGALPGLANDAAIDQLSGNSVVISSMALTNEAIGETLIRSGELGDRAAGLTGSGVGVAVIDSGVANVPELKGRVVANVDFTGTSDRDEYGHGTHVAGIIAAAGVNKNDSTSGVAPGAQIISLKVLNAQGAGLAGDVIEAIDWAVTNKAAFNIKVINLSLGAPVLQSWRDDPLCQAVERAFHAGIVVVASAGNHGKSADGRPIFGAITAPGNSPYAITVGALNTKGTAARSDDVVASYSSKGPTLFDHLIKPDLVAPGNKIVGLAAPGSTLVREHPELMVQTANGRRLQLSGTSMAAGVVSGVAAQLLQATPQATPMIVRTRLQLGSEPMPGIGLMATGAGSLNAVGALAAPRTGKVTIAGEAVKFGAPVFGDSMVWGEALVWGESMVWGEALVWGESMVWGEALVWGESMVWGEALVWGESMVWGEALVWGESMVWGEALVWGESMVWGEALVWGESMVWGEALVWGESMVWGEALVWGESMVWGEALVWGESMVWGE